MPDFARLYAKARGSKTFLVALVMVVGGWLALSALTGFDADHGLINLFLSTEASVSLAFFTMVSDAQSQAQGQQAEALAQMVKAILSIAEAQRDVLSDHAELLRALREHDARILQTLTTEKEGQ